VGLPSEHGVFATFIVADLRPYFDEDEEIPTLRSNSNQPEEDEGDHARKPLETLPNGPAEAKESKVIKEV